MGLNFSKSAEVVLFGADMGKSRLTHYNVFEDFDIDGVKLRSEMKVSADDETMSLVTRYIHGGRIKNLLSQNI